ncbi:hypothetical protein IGI50_000643 [Enterococcus sp. DIV0170]
MLYWSHYGIERGEKNEVDVAVYLTLQKAIII